MVFLCKGCPSHPFQDKTYGFRIRVQNKTKDHNEYRCTVCAKVNTFSGGSILIKKEQ